MVTSTADPTSNEALLGVELDVAEAVDVDACATSTPSTTRGRGSSSATSAPGSSGSPASSSAAPPASRAATGAKTSRPWNVAEIGRSAKRRAPDVDRLDHAPGRSAAERQQPVVGPDEHPPVREPQRDAPPRPRRRPGRPPRDGPRPAGTAARAGGPAPPLRTSRAAPDAVEVDHARVGADARDHPVADADEVVVEPVVGQERDDAARLTGARPRPPPAPRSSPSMSWRLASTSRLEAVLAQRRARHRADADEPRSQAPSRSAPTDSKKNRTVEDEVNVT